MTDNKLSIYFAHPICDYGTKKESDIVQYLEDLDYKVVNPADYQQQYQDWLNGTPAAELGSDGAELPPFNGSNKMAFWVALAESCDEIAFCAFDSSLEAEGAPAGYHGLSDSTGFSFDTRPTIRIGAGVWKEVNSFFKAGKPVLFTDATLIEGSVVGGSPNQETWHGNEMYIRTNEDNTCSTLIQSRNVTEWPDCFILLSVDETKALLRASGRYDG